MVELPAELLARLERVLNAVEHLLPPPAPAIDWSVTLAARWQSRQGQGYLEALPVSQGLSLDDLLGIERQKARVDLNTRQFLHGLPANNVLLWGARGTGKSSLVRALLNTYHAQGLRVIEVDKEELVHLPGIVAALQQAPYKFLIYCDDLSFEADEPGYKALKSALDGSLYAPPDNVLIYATSNRRHLLPEYMQENQAAHWVDGELHQGDAVEEKISLSDRFGLWISFYPFQQEAYLQVARHWVERLARQRDLPDPWNEQARLEALQFAQGKGVRSGRTAYQFASHWVGQRLLMR